MLYNDHGHTTVQCFSDADRAGSKSDKRSTIGYCVFVRGNLVCQKNKKQNMVSRSSAKSKYRAMTPSICEIIQINHLLQEDGINVASPVKIQCDNQIALHITSNSVYHEWAKYIGVDYNLFEQLGDLFTKALNGLRIEYLCNKLCMINIHVLT